MHGKNVSIYGVHIPGKCIEFMHFYTHAQFPLKTPGRIFGKAVSPRGKGWKKLRFVLSIFNQKI